MLPPEVTGSGRIFATHVPSNLNETDLAGNPLRSSDVFFHLQTAGLSKTRGRRPLLSTRRKGRLIYWLVGYFDYHGAWAPLSLKWRFPDKENVIFVEGESKRRELKRGDGEASNESSEIRKK